MRYPEVFSLIAMQSSSLIYNLFSGSLTCTTIMLSAEWGKWKEKTAHTSREKKWWKQSWASCGDPQHLPHFLKPKMAPVASDTVCTICRVALGWSAAAECLGECFKSGSLAQCGSWGSTTAKCRCVFSPFTAMKRINQSLKSCHWHKYDLMAL